MFPQAVCPFFVSSLCNDIFSSACREGQSCLCILLNTIPQKAQLHDPPLNALVPTLIFLICFIRPNVTFVFILSPNTFSKLKCPHLKKEICIYLSGSCRSLAPEKQKKEWKHIAILLGRRLIWSIFSIWRHDRCHDEK